MADTQSMTSVLVTTVPGTAEHKAAQRARIIAAARRRFIRHGFHGASMATIAETAGMSPGLIYRYFANKNAVILAIIDEQLTMAQRRIRELRSTDDLCAGLVAYFNAHDTDEEGPLSAALFMEIAAEATRDAEIARAVSRYDRAVRAEFVDWLCRAPEEGGRGLSLAAAEQRALLLVLLIEGLKVRKVREPELDCLLLKQALDAITRAIAP